MSEFNDRSLKIDNVQSFADNAYAEFTHLPEILYTRGIKTVIIAGLATDYCVKFIAIDARKFGFRTFVIEDAIRAVDPQNVQSALDTMKRWGCEIVDSDSIPE